MIACRLKKAALFVFLSGPTLLLAQEISSTEEQRLEALARAQAEVYIPRSKVSVGFRVLTSGANVHYGNLGNVPFATTQAALSDGAVNRTYDNGYVHSDTPRADESDADGVQTSTPGGRYIVKTTVTYSVTDPDGNIIGNVTNQETSADELSYTPGRTRYWSYSLPSQAEQRPGYIAMSSYSAESNGSAFDKKQGPVGGLELQFARILGKATGRLQWSLLTGVSLNDVSSKSARDISATLRTNTDFYSLNGLDAPVTSVDSPYAGPVFPDNVTETTVPVSTVPVDHIETATAGGATVHGKYQVKGAYFLVKVGPGIHTQLTERFGVSASAGVAGAYSGTRYSATEIMDVPEMGTTIANVAPLSSDTTKFLGGYYADFNIDFAASETTGLFAGFTAQKFGDYTQTLGTRTAKIDLGSSVGLRGGISVRF